MVTTEHPQSKDASWVFNRWGKRETYEVSRDELLQLLEDHSKHVRLESIGEVYRDLQTAERNCKLGGFRQAKDLVYDKLTKPRAA